MIGSKLKLKLIKKLSMNDILQDSKLSAFVDKLSKTLLPLDQKITHKAQEVIESMDFPTTRNEAWKYTRLGKITGIKLENKIDRVGNLSREKINSLFQVSKNGLTFVYENGLFRSDLSSGEFPKGATIKPLTGCSKEELKNLGANIKLENEVFNAINTLFAVDGMFISIDKNVVINEPIQFIHLLSGSNAIANTRNYIQLAPFSKAEIIQSYYSLEAEKAFTNVINEINIAENAMLTINKLQCETENSFHISTDQVAQEKNSNFSINTITLNGTLVRNNLNIEVNGTNCETHLNGIYLLKENQHVDNHTVVDHKAAHCESHELYKGVIDDKATAVFNGKVFVRKDSQKINAFQSNANVLLSDDATVNSKPELEIYADDVKCSHGSTTGQLNEEAVFYLRARGISEKSARHLMISAFIEDVISKIENEDVKNFTHSIIKERFGWEF